AVKLSKATIRNVKQNLFWAFFYNVVMIPVAAGAFSTLGFVFQPWIAALCMSLSSLFVVGNALRLLRYKNKKIIKEDIFMKKIVHIEGMCCEHCAKRVENAISAVSGVVSADVKLKKNIAVIRSREEIADSEITAVVAEAGYTVKSIEVK
ncbi:MAG: cation transporter, partial [Clostridia bacterium]|nr:cation transporter [Clostridia bacterium]